jgi:hypothetical protein
MVAPWCKTRRVERTLKRVHCDVSCFASCRRARGDCKYTQQNKATIDSLRSLVEEPGPYVLRVKTDVSFVIDQPLEYAFQVRLSRSFLRRS